MLEPKNLGSLSRASAILDDDAGRSLDVKLNNRGAVDLYRFIFRSAQDASIVASLADEAMMEEFNAWEASAAARSAEHDHLIDAVRKSLGGGRPLLFQGVQLLGPDPSGNTDDSGSEVLLGEGIIALLDPNWQGNGKKVASTNIIGKYELLFFSHEEGAHAPFKRFPIGPKMVLQVQDRERAEIDDEEEPALSFSLSISGEVFTLAFESMDVAEAFERDFTVRQRLMTIGLSTAKKTQEVAKLSKSPLRISLERTANVVFAIPVVALALAWQSRAVASALCHLFCH